MEKDDPTMKIWQKLLLGSAAAIALTGAANAQTALTVGTDTQEIDAGNDFGTNDLVGDGGTTLITSDAEPGATQAATLILRVTDATNAFGVGASPANVRVDLSGTGFVLNGTPVIGSSVADTGGGAPVDECAEVTFGGVDSGGCARSDVFCVRRCFGPEFV
ncbi:hypothetical protein [Rhodothalassium salexigens]|uniref:hypothetical protein n=1 Tax=Rhodothalassium salexigens TaxID=1086 RepID=UPI00104EF8F3|nr:hypothetical protein [Rhodothalassium salexigens]